MLNRFSVRSLWAAILVAGFVGFGTSGATAQERPLRDSYVRMEVSDRHNVQSFLAAKGLYNAGVDGLWGNMTEEAVQKLKLLYPERYGRFDVETSEGAAAFLQRIASDFIEEYPEGGYEGESSDGDRLSPVPSGDAHQARALEARCDGYASFAGLCWQLSKSEMMIVMNNRGYNCKAVPPDSNQFLIAASGGGIPVPEFVCVDSSTGGGIAIYANRLVFDCDIFNVCPYRTDEIAQIIVDEGHLAQMDYAANFSNSGEILERYCGRTYYGQEICVGVEIYFTLSKLRAISLARGALGRPGVNFD
ncbi:peptidoglycan-binding domain-containing protein [Rhodobacteraceae bacterium G21628-S1]|nr:peptidoglycan-binding domain-containing protein [Rhodobacteraceae bacterium G21628-S1]